MKYEEHFKIGQGIEILREHLQAEYDRCRAEDIKQAIRHLLTTRRYLDSYFMMRSGSSYSPRAYLKVRAK